ncbi:MAG: FAD-dependent oxidoreductase [Saprospiraceae bacterium]|nr:FAD-dependent oxidoreductase [Saprospiraceae bacterium]
MNCEFLIIGQGLAGTLLGHALEQIQANFVVLDKVLPYAASPVAAGIIHPVSGRRFVKAWNYDSLLPAFQNTYAQMRNKIGLNPLENLDMHLNLSSVREENDLLSQAHRYGYVDQLVGSIHEDPVFKTSNARYTIPAYKVNIQAMISLFRKRWLGQNIFYPVKLNYNHLKQVKNKWQYQDITADQVVFCEGCYIRDNPWFKHLPIVPNKGQVLILKKPDGYSLNNIMRQKLLFTGFKHSIWTGATYEWEFDSPSPDSTGWKYLNQNLTEAVKIPLEVELHAAGLRPTVSDRKPIIASHPQFPNLWTINGLGTKGASIGPFIINEFIGLMKDRINSGLFAPDRLKE